MAPPTIQKQLDEALKESADLKAKLLNATEKWRQAATEYDVIKKQRDETRAQFDDLKKRLHESEMENQRLRGYIERVQEDDIVREELILTGDPEGECRQVPKRKSAIFAQPRQYTDFDSGQSSVYSGYRDRPKPKHWIEY